MNQQLTTFASSVQASIRWNTFGHRNLSDFDESYLWTADPCLTYCSVLPSWNFCQNIGTVTLRITPLCSKSTCLLMPFAHLVHTAQTAGVTKTGLWRVPYRVPRLARLRGSWPSLICHGARWCSRTASGSDRKATVFLNQSVFFLTVILILTIPFQVWWKNHQVVSWIFLLVEFQWFFIKKLDSHSKKKNRSVIQVVSNPNACWMTVNFSHFSHFNSNSYVGEAEAARLRAEIEELVQRVPLVPKWWEDDWWKPRNFLQKFDGLSTRYGFIVRFQKCFFLFWGL